MRQLLTTYDFYDLQLFSIMIYLRNIILWVALASCSQAQTTVQPDVPTGYLYKVEPGIPGKIVYVCGQRPFNTKGELIGPGDLAAQTKQVFTNITTALATVNMTLDDVDQVTYLVKEPSGTNVVSKGKATIVQAAETNNFKQVVPKISETKAVTQTVREDVLIESEVIAIK